MLSFLNNFLLICDFCKPLKHSLFCNPDTSRDYIKDNLTICADRFFEILDSFLAEYMEPLELPDFSSAFNYTLVTPYYWDVNLTEGSLRNLSSIKRGGDFNSDKSPKKSEIVLPLIFEALSFGYNYSAAIMGYGPRGTVVGVMKGLKMDLVLGYVYKQSELTLDFRATALEYFDLEFDGHYYIDWILNMLSDILIILLRAHILSSVEDAVKDATQKYITDLNRMITDYQSTLLPLFIEKLLHAAAVP